VIGFSSNKRSEGLISADKFVAIDVKNWLNFWAISKGLLIVVPLKIISEIEFFVLLQ
jgi:hypothetical protein